MSNKKKEIEFNEGLTISEDGVDKKNIDSWITFILQPFLKEYDDKNKDRKFSFVKVSNLCYDTQYWDGFGINVNTHLLNSPMEAPINPAPVSQYPGP